MRRASTVRISPARPGTPERAPSPRTSNAQRITQRPQPGRNQIPLAMRVSPPHSNHKLEMPQGLKRLPALQEVKLTADPATASQPQPQTASARLILVDNTATGPGDVVPPPTTKELDLESKERVKLARPRQVFSPPTTTNPDPLRTTTVPKPKWASRMGGVMRRADTVLISLPRTPRPEPQEEERSSSMGIGRSEDHTVSTTKESPLAIRVSPLHSNRHLEK